MLHTVMTNGRLCHNYEKLGLEALTQYEYLADTSFFFLSFFVKDLVLVGLNR